MDDSFDNAYNYPFMLGRNYPFRKTEDRGARRALIFRALSAAAPGPWIPAVSSSVVPLNGLSSTHTSPLVPRLVRTPIYLTSMQNLVLRLRVGV